MMNKKILSTLLIIILASVGISFVWIQNMNHGQQVDCPFLKLMQWDCAKMVSAMTFLNHHISTMAYLTNFTLQELYSMPLLILLIFSIIMTAVYVTVVFFINMYLKREMENLTIYKAPLLRWMAIFRSLNPEDNYAAYDLQ